MGNIKSQLRPQTMYECFCNPLVFCCQRRNILLIPDIDMV